MKIIVNGKEKILLDKNEPCTICNSSRDKMFFSWNMFHGEATSSCCGAIYQLKDYYIDKPTEEQVDYLKLLARDYIELSIKQEYIEPLQRAMKELSAKNINEEGVIKLAENYVELENKK